MASETRGGRAKVAGTKRRKMYKDIEDMVSEAASDDDKNPTSLKNTLKGRNKSRNPKPGKLNKNSNKTPDIPKDPTPPRKMGGEKTMQMPYKRRMSMRLGTSELPVGGEVPDRMRPAGSTYKSGNSTSKFSEGGEVRQGDVRDNAKRGKCY